MKQAESAYTMGYQAAYGATSWGLSGREFDVVAEAVDRAEEAYRRHGCDGEDPIVWKLDYASAFVAYCLRHSGTWTAEVDGWQGEGLYSIGYSDGGMDWTSDGPVWLETAEDLANELAAAWLCGATDTHLPSAEYLGGGEE